MKTNHIALLEDDCLSSVTGGSTGLAFRAKSIPEVVDYLTPNTKGGFSPNNIVRKCVLPNFGAGLLQVWRR